MNLLDKKKNIQSKNSINIEKEKKVEHIVASTKFKKKKRNLLDKNKIISELEKYLNEFNLWILHLLKQIKNYKYTKFVFLKIQNNKYVQKLASKTKKNKHVRKTYFYWKKQNVFVRTFSAATVIIMLVYLCVTPFIPFLTSGKSIENNTDISYSNNSNNTLYENTNPNFTVGFGDKTNPTEQRVVFAAKPAEKSGFIQAKDSSVFDKIGDYVFGVPEKSVEMKFSSAEFNENLEQSIYDVVKSQIPEEKTELAKKNIAKVVAANRDIKTSTKLIKNDAESKQDKIVNPSIAPDTDIEYQVIKGEGIKENIVINQSDSFQKECVKSLLDESGNVKCNVPKNRYVFDMKLDENIKLHVLNQALDDLPVGTFFFTDEKDKYLFHILPPVAEDAAKKKTTDIKYNVEKVNDREYKFYVTISLNWLLSNDRVYPVKIDPTIVHNTKASFDTGSLNRAESLDGPKVQTAGNEMLVDRNTMGLWHMNEASGTSVGDSANGNTGTAANAATVVSGIYGNGRSFNGTSDKITVAQSNSLTTVKQISIEAWIKPSGSAAQPIVEYGDAIRFGVHMWQYDGSGGTNHFSTLFCNFVGIYTSGIDHRMIWSPPGSIVAGNWYHVACVYDEYYAKLYINGKEVASQYFSGDIALYTALPLNIGYRPAGGNYFNGTIDEVKISNNARSADEIKADAQRRPYSVYTSPIMDLGADTSSLNSLNWTQKGVRMGSIDTPMDSNSKVAQWPMNETSGTTMTMTSGSCGAPCNGTLYGFANTSGQDVAAYSGWTSNNTKDNGSLMFDGVDDYVNVTTNSSINFTGDMSTEFWVNPGATQSNSYATIFSRHGTGTAGYTLEQNNANSNQYYFSWGNGTAWACNTETLITLSPNVWQYVAISKSGSTVTAYVNGVLNGTCTGTFSVIASNSLNLKIGQSSTNAGRFFKGMLDSMRFYSRALTVDEIITNYGATNIGFETRTGTTATPDSTDLSDGTNWEKWKSVTDSGTSLETNISDSESTTLYNTTDTGLQSYWPMDESANSNSCNSGTYDYCDIVGTNGATGSTTKPKINDGVYGNSRGFDGSSSFASVTSSSSISPTSALTVEGWFKPAKTFDNTADYNQGIVDKGDYQFFLDKTDGKAKWVVNDNTAKAFSALGSGASSTVVALTTWKGALYAAGYFTSIGTCVSGCSYVAKWDGSTWTALSTGLNNVARVLEVYNGNLYAGGDFTTAGTCITNCTYLAKWDGTTWSAVGVPLNGVVISLAVMNGVLYVGGSFVNAGGISVNRIAQWNGTSWSALGGGANGPVNALTIWNGNLYAGGNFTIIGGVTVYYIAKWNGTVWSALSASPANAFVLTLAVWNGNLYAGGSFTIIGTCSSGCNYVAKWDGSNWTNSGTGANGKVRSMGVYDGNLLIGGDFTTVGTCSSGCNYIAKWNGTTWSSLGSNITGSTGIGIYGITTFDGNLFIGGYFTAAGACSVSCINITKYGSSNTLTIASKITTWNPDSWYHFAAVSSGTTLSLYINGVLQNSASSSITLSANGLPLLFGRSYGTQINDSSDEMFFGNIDEVRIYNTAVSAATIQDHYKTRSNNPASLTQRTDTNIKVDGSSSYAATSTSAVNDAATLGLYHFDESGGTGAYLHDSSGNGNNATPTSTTAKGDCIGRICQLFNGTSSYVSLPNNFADNLDAFSAELWAYPQLTPSYARFIDFGTTNGLNNYTFDRNGTSNDLRFTAMQSGVATCNLIAKNVLERDQWQHIAVTYDIYGVASIYKNGELVGSKACTAPIKQSRPNSYIGKSNWVADSYYQGYMDEIRISNVARTPQEIQDNYNLQKQQTVNYQIPSTDLSTKSKLSFWFASEKAGAKYTVTAGESDYANYEPDANTVGLWHMEDKDTEYTENYAGTTIDTNRWVEIDPNNNKISQNNAIVLSAGTVADWDSGIISQAAYPAQDGMSFYYAVTTGSSVASPNLLMVGLGQDQVASASITTLSHALRFDSGGVFHVFQDGLCYGACTSLGTVAINTTYYVLIYLNADGSALYKILGGAYATWTTLLEADNPKTNKTYRAQIAQYRFAGSIVAQSVNTNKFMDDSSGYRNDAQNRGNAEVVTGKVGNGRFFNGSSEWAMVKDSNLSTSTTNITGNFTIDAWIKPAVITGGNHTIFTKQGTKQGYFLIQYNANIYFGFGNGSSWVSQTSTSNPLTIGVWTHVVGTYDGSNLRTYVNGVLIQQTAATGTPAVTTTFAHFGQDGYYGNWFNGVIDEVRVSNVARSATDIRQTFEAGDRAYNIVNDFSAYLDSGNLISNSSDLSFTISPSVIGSTVKADRIFAGDKIIVRENYDGTDYVAYGNVDSVNVSTGALTVSSWDTGSTFPASGYTIMARLFKWQREFMDVSNYTPSSKNAITRIVVKNISGGEANSYWIDGFKSISNELTNPSGTLNILSTPKRYFQYRAVISSADMNVTPYLTSVTLDYSAISTDSLMRHGAYFSNGSKQSYWWAR